PPRNLRMKAFAESGEGTAVILLCAVDSNPPSQLTLLKEGRPVASSPAPGWDHPSDPVPPAPNALRLELPEALEEDEGEYECRARSPLGSARTSLPLRVRGESGFAVGWGASARGPPGGMVTTSGNPLPGWVWGGPGCLASCPFPTSPFSQHHDAPPNPIGPLPPEVFFFGGEPAVLVIADAPREPSFTSLVDPHGGLRAVLLCTADSFPPSDIALHRGPGLTPLASARGAADPRFTVQAAPNSLRLEMGGLELRDAGVYVCSANNSLGTASSSLRLDLGGVTVAVEPSPEVPEGATATVTCSAVPWVGAEANYTWYKNGRWLRDGPAASLVLAPVTSADTGSYHCRASGTRGSAASAPLSLSVLCECPRGSHATAPHQPRLPRADPPRDVTVSTFLENRSGRVGIVLCVADSHPPSAIALYRRGLLLASSLAPAAAATPDVRASASHNALRLELGAVGPEDSGEYVCVATNPLGNATAGAYFDARTLTHLLVFTVLAGLLAAVISLAALALLAAKLWPRMRRFWGWSGAEDTFELRSKQEPPQVRMAT
ncbi:SN protein, partial [Lophotis ruficrista]|nr:SN protein [Lophotis ruficrista]